MNCTFLDINKYVPFKTLGNKDITWAMLEAGAETDVVNSVGRTAAQMAAFVGELLYGSFYIRLYPKFSPWKEYYFTSQRTNTVMFI